MMGVYDTIVLLIVLAGAFIGWRKGLASQVASIVSIVASYFVAVNFREQVAAQIDTAPPWNTFAAMLILFVGTSLVIWLLFRQVRNSIEAMKLKDFDYQMGGLFGGFKGFIIASLVTLFAITLLHENQRQVILRSKSGALIARFLNGATPIMPDEVRNFLGPYIDRLDQELELGPREMQLGGGYPPNGRQAEQTGSLPPFGYGGNQPSYQPQYSNQFPQRGDGSQLPIYRPVTPPEQSPLAPGVTPWGGTTNQDQDWRATTSSAGNRF